MKRRYLPLLCSNPCGDRAGVLDSVHQKSKHFASTNNGQRNG